MANEFKISGPLVLGSLASDPSTGYPGEIYYNSVSNNFRMYNGTSWEPIAAGSVSLTGQVLNSENIIVGNGSNLSAAVDTSAVGDILADPSTGLTIKSGVITDSEINATAAIALSKLAALTPGFAVQSNASTGFLEDSAVTNTELGYVSGVTSSIQTQLDGKANTALSNLASVAINSSLLPGSGGAIDLGTATLYWNQLFVSQIHSQSGGGNILMHAGLITDASNANAIDFLNRDLIDAAGHTAVFWGGRTLIDTATSSQLSWSTSGVTFNQLTATTVPYLNGSKILTSSAVTPTELGYLSGVSSAIQTQLNGKLSLSGGTMTGAINMGGEQINDLADPSLAQDAATKNYVDTTTTPDVMTTAGDLIYENATPAPARLAIGSTGQVLTVVAGLPSWQTATAGANTSLSNLITTSINQDLLPSVTNTRVLGSASLTWSSLWVNEILAPSAMDIQLTTGRFYNNTGSYVIDAYNNILADNSQQNSIDWQNRLLIDTAGATQLAWSTSGVEFNQLTASTVPYLSAGKVLTSSAVTPTELGYVSGVTSSIQTQLDGKLSLTGGTMSGVIDLGGNTPVNSGTPVNPNDLVNKSYVDNFINATSWKPAVLVATTANITLSGEQTIDGILTSASRVLVKNQTAPEDNGIYVSAAGAWARAADMSAWSQIPAAAVFVESGTVNADLGWVCVSQPGGTIGTTAINFVQFSSAGAYSADNITLQLISGVFSVKNAGITEVQIASSSFSTTGAIVGGSGTKISANVDGSTIDINGSNELEVKAGGITATQLASASVTAAKLGTITDGITLDQSGSGATLEIKTGGVNNAQIGATANIDYSKLASLPNDSIAVTDGTGHISGSSNANPVLLNAAGFQRSSTDGSGLIQESYYHGLVLTDNSTGASFSYAGPSSGAATYAGYEVTYIITCGNTEDQRIGRLRVIAAQDGSSVSFNDDYAESGDCGVVWSASIDGSGNIVLSYATSNQGGDRAMNADVKLFAFN